MGVPVAAAAAATAGLGALSVVPLWALERETATALAGLMHAAALAVAIVAMIVAARASAGPMRAARWCFVASLTAVAAGTLIAVGYVVTVGAVPVPSLADAVLFLWVPLAILGFWRVPTRDGIGVPTRRLVADAAVAASALLFASWLVVLQPMLATGRWSNLGLATQLAYPVCDAVVVALVLSLLPRARADLRAFLNCVAAGLLLIAVSDSGSALLLSQRGVVAFGWPDVTLQAGMALLAFAALSRHRPVMNPRRRFARIDLLLPFVPVVLAAGVGLSHIATVGSLTLDAALLGALMLAALLARQAVYIAELSGAAARHRHAASHDELTGLANRKAFLERLEEHVTTPGAPPAAVLIADLDGFKEVNDSFGHDCGDVLLARFAAARAAGAGTHVPARLGGDVFAVLVVDDDPETTALTLARRLLAAGLPPASGVVLSCSIGVAGLRPGDLAVDALRRADLAMYSAKRARQSHVAVFVDAMAEQSDRRNLLIAALPGAVARGEMQLVYQPLYRLADHRIAGAEALLRWRHPLFGAVPPDEFIPLAEDSGQIREIGSWVLDAALEQLARWDVEGRQLDRLFVNAAAAQFTDDLPELVATTLRRYGIAAERLTLEITESELPDLAANSAMSMLRETGVHIALDDFGSGYSSLAQLARLPVDVLKIDRDVIRNLDATAGRPVLDAIVGLAKALGLATVAEGIETGCQAAAAADGGVDYAQGYLFSRPLPPDELTQLLPRRSDGPATRVPQPRPDTLVVVPYPQPAAVTS